MEFEHYEFGRIVSLLGLRKREANRMRVISESVTLSFLRGLEAALASLDYTIKTSPKEICLVSFERVLMGLGRKEIWPGY